MIVNFGEQKLDQIWSNFGRDYLDKKILEQGARSTPTAATVFWIATQLHLRG
jgi:hypothetical protein